MFATEARWWFARMGKAQYLGVGGAYSVALVGGSVDESLAEIGVLLRFFLNTILRHRNCSKQFQYFSLTLFACGCYLILFPTYLSFLFVKFESFDHLFATKVICLLIPIMVCLFQCGSLLWHYWPCACGMLAMNPELTIGTVFYRFLAWLAW